MDQPVSFLPPIQVSKSYDWLMDTPPNTQPSTHPAHNKINEPISPPDDRPSEHRLPPYRQLKNPPFIAPPRTSSIKSQSNPQRGLYPVVIPQPSSLTRIMMPSPPVSPRTPTFSAGQRTSASSFGSTSTSTSTSSSASSTYKPDRQVFMKQWMRILDDAERMVVRGEMEKDRGRNL
ncbi:hypothetical protein SpCBS45565_g08153 [Spizellomyces sp. 'palustris']|nr:hypothetical protein SpCBS45565_g08153 [Spizellomyces sp. 'palustris']